MADASSELLQRYRRALKIYTGREAGNAALVDGFGFGRSMLAEGRGLIELLSMHQSVVPSLISGTVTAAETVEVLAQSGEFLAEVAAPFEMTHRGWREAVGNLRRLNESLEHQVAERTAALRDSERRFQDIAEVSGDWMWETDREHRFTLLFGERIDGLPIQREALMGRTRWEGAGADLGNDEVWADHKADLDAHRPFRHFRYEIRLSTGAAMFISASGKPIFDQDGNFVGYRGTATDETAIVEARRRAEAAEGVLRRVFETSLDLIVITDSQGTIVRVSPSATSLLGYDPEELIGHSGTEIVYPEDLDNTSNQMRAARRSGVAQSFECRYVHKQGRLMTFWWKGVWSAAERQYFFIGRDISDRQETERRLRESEDQLKRAQRLARMGSDLRDLKTGTREWSDEAYRIFGVSRATFEATLENVFNMIHPEDQPLVIANRARTAAGACPPPFEYRIIRPDGELRHVYREWELIYDEAGNPAQLLGTIQDVTERRRIEEQLRQAQKMEAIGNLTGGMAHDFNNLLGIIVGYLGLAREQISGDEGLAAMVDEALDAAWRGADLTRRLLAFARRQPLRPVRIEANDLIENTVRLLRRLLGEDIEVSLHPAPDIWPIVADPAQLEAAIANLGTNARDAMPHGGRLIIATGNRHLDADYVTEHAEATVGDFVMIEVSDTGSGMTAEVMSRIFEPFFTTKEQGKGTGLGLSMVFGFLRQSGGHVSVYSEPGVGTTFRLYLPRATTDVQAAEIRPDALIEPGGGEVVLVVEDNPGMRRIVVRQLRNLGYSVVECERAAEALDLLQRDTIDLLFTDIVMPGGLDGVELALLARERWPGLKIVLTSGFPQERINTAGGAPHGIKLLSKPYRLQELAAILKSVLHE
jgi:PAS domain S-box-containing protein